MNKDKQIDWNEVRRRVESAAEALERETAASPEETRAILKKRGRALAHKPRQDEEERDFLEIIEFRLSQETYGIESAFVREVYPLRDITPVPCTPSFVLGIVNVRGQILSVVDLKKFFNLPEKGLGDLNKIIILRSGMMEFGILADVIHGTRSISHNSIQPPLPTISGIGLEYIKGITGDRVILLDAKTILHDDKILVNELIDQ